MCTCVHGNGCARRTVHCTLTRQGIWSLPKRLPPKQKLRPQSCPLPTSRLAGTFSAFPRQGRAFCRGLQPPHFLAQQHPCVSLRHRRAVPTGKDCTSSSANCEHLGRFAGRVRGWHPVCRLGKEGGSQGPPRTQDAARLPGSRRGAASTGERRAEPADARERGGAADGSGGAGRPHTRERTPEARRPTQGRLIFQRGPPAQGDGGECTLRSFLLCRQKTAERGKGELRFAWVSSEPAQRWMRGGARGGGEPYGGQGGGGAGRGSVCPLPPPIHSPPGSHLPSSPPPSDSPTLAPIPFLAARPGASRLSGLCPPSTSRDARLSPQEAALGTHS